MREFKTMGCYACIVMMASFIGLSRLSTAQSICVPDPVEVDHLEGAVFLEVGSQSTALGDVTVSISPYVGQDVPPFASFVTKGDGRFSIENVAPGRYWLSFRHTALIS